MPLLKEGTGKLGPDGRDGPEGVSEVTVRLGAASSFLIKERNVCTKIRFVHTFTASAQALSVSRATDGSSFASIILKTIGAKKSVGTSLRLAVH